MTLDYSAFWFSVLIGIAIMFISLAILFGLKIAYSEDLPCLEYSDGTLAVVKYSSRGGCDADSGAMNTISYLLKKGYHIDAVVPNSDTGDWMIDLGVVFMSRHP